MIGDILALDGLWLLIGAALLAGIVRGFAGFGTGMVYVPFAAQVLDPVWVLITVVTLDILGPTPAVPGALRAGQPRDVARLGAGALVGTPVGILLLTSFPPQVFRYSVALVTTAVLACLVAGLRYRGPVRPGLIYGTGGLAGLIGGAVGLAGPPVILLYMARDLPVAVIRANIMLFLILSDVILLSTLGLGGLLELQPVLLGGLLMLPYLLAVWIGTQVFDPGRGSVYRLVAYAIIAGSVINGLPVWD